MVPGGSYARIHVLAHRRAPRLEVLTVHLAMVGHLARFVRVDLFNDPVVLLDVRDVDPLHARFGRFVVASGNVVTVLRTSKLFVVRALVDNQGFEAAGVQGDAFAGVRDAAQGRGRTGSKGAFGGGFRCRLYNAAADFGVRKFSGVLPVFVVFATAGKAAVGRGALDGSRVIGGRHSPIGQFVGQRVRRLRLTFVVHDKHLRVPVRSTCFSTDKGPFKYMCFAHAACFCALGF